MVTNNKSFWQSRVTQAVACGFGKLTLHIYLVFFAYLYDKISLRVNYLFTK